MNQQEGKKCRIFSKTNFSSPNRSFILFSEDLYYFRECSGKTFPTTNRFFEKKKTSPEKLVWEKNATLEIKKNEKNRFIGMVFAWHRTNILALLVNLDPLC